MASAADRPVELRLRAAVESSPSGLLMVDPEGRIVLVNREIERLFGYSREELLGRSVDLLVPDALRSAHDTHRAGFISAPSVRSMGEGRDLYGRRKDGTLVPVEIGLTPVATEEGMFVLSSVVDITARRRSEARFRAAVESSPAGMVMVEQDGRIVLVNREVERMFGYSRDDLLGQSIEMLVPERYRRTHPASRTSFFAAPQVRSMGAGRELFGLRSDGTEIPVEIGLNPIETDEGLWVLASVVDITARLENEAVREGLEAQLHQAQKMEAVGTLAGGIAHDFNNILGGIMGYGEILRNSARDPATRADIDDLLAFTHRGKELVDRILTFSRKHEPTDRLPIAVPLAIGEVISLLRASMGPRIHIREEVDPATPRLLADPVAIHQVLMNLGMNGAHAMPEGGELIFAASPLYVTDSVARAHPTLREGLHVALTVRDTGRGMDPSVQARAFEPFFTTKEPGQGSGLGLAIVHGIISKHGGAVDLESLPDQGTSVRCLIPAADPSPVQEPLQHVPLPHGNGERVLIVDDEARLGEVSARRLQAIGYRTVVETRGGTALARLRSDPGGFDLVMTDYLMPEMTGIEFAEAVHSISPRLPVLLLTGYAEDLSDKLMVSAGVDLVVRKPVSLDELAAALRALLTRKEDGPTAGEADA